MGARVKDPSTGQFKEIYVKALDSMPVGSIVEYNGTVGDIPAGWEQANDIIWTNSSPSSTISTSTISNIDMTNYDELEVGFRQYNSNDILTIARFKKVIGTTPVLSYSEVGNGFWVIRSRVLNLTSNTSIGITQGYQTVTGGTASASDNVCIPVYIKGYNTGLIKKTSETRPLASHTVNAYSESESNAYSCDYVNGALDYSTDEVNTHKKWIDGKDIYRKAYQVTLPNSSADSVIISGLNNIEVINISGMATATMGGDTFKFEINSYHSDTWSIVVYNIGTQIRCKIGSSFYGASANIILEYTKTTD